MLHLQETLEAYQKNDPAARSKWEVLLLYNGLHAIICYRISHWLWEHRCRFLARLLSQLAKWLTGVEIHPAATIGRRLVIDHGTGIVVGATTEIGDNARVAANSVVLREVPENSTVVGIPGRIVRINGEKTDHIHTPDPHSFFLYFR